VIHESIVVQFRKDGKRIDGQVSFENQLLFAACNFL